jgi:putative FmdB family regulatory protein
MALYEYECDACGQRFEVIKRYSDPLEVTCARCGKGPVHRLVSSPAIQFKGTGWYITDYARKGQSDGGPSGKSDGKTDAKSDTKADAKTDSKTDTKTESKTDSKTQTKADTKSSSEKSSS